MPLRPFTFDFPSTLHVANLTIINPVAISNTFLIPRSHNHRAKFPHPTWLATCEPSFRSQFFYEPLFLFKSRFPLSTVFAICPDFVIPTHMSSALPIFKPISPQPDSSTSLNRHDLPAIDQPCHTAIAVLYKPPKSPPLKFFIDDIAVINPVKVPLPPSVVKLLASYCDLIVKDKKYNNFDAVPEPATVCACFSRIAFFSRNEIILSSSIFILLYYYLNLIVLDKKYNNYKQLNEFQTTFVVTTRFVKAYIPFTLNMIISSAANDCRQLTTSPCTNTPLRIPPLRHIIVSSGANDSRHSSITCTTSLRLPRKPPWFTVSSAACHCQCTTISQLRHPSQKFDLTPNPLVISLPRIPRKPPWCHLLLHDNHDKINSP
jgi:hypothetical protein